MAPLPASVPSPLIRVSANFRRRQIVDHVATGVMTLCAALAVVGLALILLYATIKGLPAINIPFFTERPLPPGGVGGGGQPALVGPPEILSLSCPSCGPIWPASA